MAHEPGRRIGAGGSAEVFTYGDGAVLKLFRPEYAFAVDWEAERTRAVHAAGIPAPRVIDVVEVRGRRGIVLERIDGPTLLDELVAGRLDARAAGAATAEVQAAVHAVPADLPRLAGGGTVAHLDLHPGNVIAGPRGPVVIDWVNAHLAPAAADVARSVTTIRYQGLGLLGAPGGVEEERTVRQRVLDGYLDRVAEPDGLARWLARTATRLLAAEPANPDRDRLQALIDAGSTRRPVIDN